MLNKMLKLTRPQKRVLRTMMECDCYIYLDDRDRHRSPKYGGFGDRTVPYRAWRFRLYKSTLRALQRRQLIRYDGYRRFRVIFVLTPKGREVAKRLKELQDAKAN